MAKRTFKHQIVYDIGQRRERYLTEPCLDSDDSKIDLRFLGEIKADHLAIQSALGEINPMTKKRYEYSLNFNNDSMFLNYKNQHNN